MSNFVPVNLRLLIDRATLDALRSHDLTLPEVKQLLAGYAAEGLVSLLADLEAAQASRPH